MNWLKFLHDISNNGNMAWMPFGIFVSVTLLGMLFGFAMGWVGAIGMLVWNYASYIILNIFIGSFTSLLSAYQVSEYLPEYILEPMIIGIWLLISNLIGYFIMFLLKGKITSRMTKYKESNVSVWQDRIIGSGIMVVGTLPVSIFGASIIAVAGEETGATAELYGIGLRGMSFGRYDTISRDKDDFNNYFDLISNDEATELFLKLLVMDEEWLDTKYISESNDANGYPVITGISDEWLADVEIINEYRDNIESIINSVDLATHFIDQIYNIAEDREIEISRKNIANTEYNPNWSEPSPSPDYELTTNPFKEVLEVSPELFGTGVGQIMGYNVSNTGILNLQNLITENIIDSALFDKAISENQHLRAEEKNNYVQRYISTYLQAYSHVENDEN